MILEHEDMLNISEQSALTTRYMRCRMQAAGLPGCRVSASSFTSCWINYSNGCVAIGTGAAGSSLSYMWQDPEPAIPDIQHVGLSCWDKHISYKEVQLLPPLAPAQLQILQLQRQAHLAVERALSQGACPEGQQQHPAHNGTLPGCLPGDSSPLNGPGWCLSAAEGHESFRGQCRISAAVPPLLQLVQQAIAAGTQPVDVCHILQLSEALLPRTHYLYEELVQLAGEWFGLLVKQHLQELSMLPADVLMDILHEPLLVRCF